MPKIQALPTWLAWNNCNFTSPTGITDQATGQPIAAGGLNQGDYFDATNDEAASASFTTNGLLYNGRYRLVQVDSGATAANVKTGTVGYLRAGTSLKTVVVTAAGSGYTPGTYNVAANISSGGGSGAIIQVVVAANGTVATPPTVIQGGFNYTSLPTFTLVAGAGTGATFAGQLNSTPNVVTSFDVLAVSGVPVRPVVFLNSITPGNFGFIQELGTATVLGNATIGTAAAGNFVESTTAGAGTVDAATTVSVRTIGQAIDLPIASQLFKILMGITATVVSD
jgi:hypothetical protein